MPDSTNPYASNVSFPSYSIDDNGQVPPAIVKKAEAIIKDAGQFWVAIILTFLCSGCGFVLVGPWYLFRLIQWNSISSQYPQLTEPNPPYGSLSQRFQSARTKLLIGMICGVILFLVLSVALFFVWTIPTIQPN